MLCLADHPNAETLSDSYNDTNQTSYASNTIESKTSLSSDSSDNSGYGVYIASGLGLAQSSSLLASNTTAASTEQSTNSPLTSSNSTEYSISPHHTSYSVSSNASVTRTSELDRFNSSTAEITSALFTVPAGGSGAEWDWACDGELRNYSYWKSFSFTSTRYNTTFWATNFSASTTTLCDGNARIMGNITSTGQYPFTSQTFDFLLYTGTPPSCSISYAACSSMQRAYTSALSQYAVENSAYEASISANLTVTAPVLASYYSNEPNCNVTSTSTTPITGCGPCNLYGGSVRLLYFPPSTEVSRDMCATVPAASTDCPFGGGQELNNTNKIGQATGPCAFYSDSISLPPDTGSYTVSNGYTFYENKAYLAYQTAYASNDCGRVGSHYSAGILPVASEDLYSVLGYHFELSNAAYQVNFADFSAPVPYSAYYNQPQCQEGGNLGLLQWPNMLNGEIVEGACGQPAYVVYDELYAPRLAVPPEFRKLDPAWSHCLLGLDGLFDPPKALQPASSAAGPTSPAAPVVLSTTSASPAQTPNSPPANTASPTTTLKAESDTQGSSTLAQPQPGSSISRSASQSSEESNEASSPQSSSNAPFDDVSGGTSTAPAQSSSANPGGAIVSALASSASAPPAIDADDPSQPSSADPGGAIISAVNDGGSFSPSTPQMIETLTGATVFGDPSDPSNIIVLGQTLTPGGATTVDGTGISVASDGSVVLGSGQSASTVIVQAVPSPQATLTADGHTLTLQQDPNHGSTLIIDGTSTATLQASGIVLLDGLTVSAETSGDPSYLVVGSQTVALGAHTALGSPLASQTSGPTPQAVVTLDGQTFTATELGDGDAIIQGTALTPGSVTTIDGVLVGVGPSGLAIGGSQTVSFSAVASVAESLGSQAIVTLGGHTFTASGLEGESLVIVNSTTLIEGGAALTIDGTIVSDGLSGLVVGGTQTIPLSYAPATGSSMGTQPAAATSSTKTSEASGFFARSWSMAGFWVAWAFVGIHHL
ncbi:hypothetical protein LTR17_004406 [Elasticomyces elasticus]|nr:hypothetical protein LTR17_004406 [Elasticomyces elasticus]